MIIRRCIYFHLFLLVAMPLIACKQLPVIPHTYEGDYWQIRTGVKNPIREELVNRLYKEQESLRKLQQPDRDQDQFSEAAVHFNEVIRIYVDVFQRFELVSKSNKGEITDAEMNEWVANVSPVLIKSFRRLPPEYQVAVKAHVNRTVDPGLINKRKNPGVEKKIQDAEAEQIQKSNTMAGLICAKLREHGLNNHNMICIGVGWAQENAAMPPEDPRQCRITIDIIAQQEQVEQVIE